MIDEIVAALAEAVSIDGLQGSTHSRFSAHVREACSTIYPSVVGDSDAPLQDSQVAYFWSQLANNEDFEVVVAESHQGEASEEEQEILPAPSEDVSGRDAPLDWHDQQRAKPTLRGGRVDSKVATNRIILDLDEDGALHKGDMVSLVEKYGDNVRLRARFERTYYALFGSRNKTSNISPSVFRVLELVARKRSKGATVVEIGQQLDFKQGSVFYLVKTLLDLGLVAKIKFIQRSSYTNLIVHHKFVNENVEYNARAEVLGAAPTTDSLAPEPSNSATLGTSGMPNFPLFGRQELRIPQFVRSRLIMLLESSLWHHLLENKGILGMLGYPGASKKEQREFQRLLQRMVKEGQLDVVSVPRSDKQGTLVRCIRLAKFRPNGLEDFEADWEGPSTAVGATFSHQTVGEYGNEDLEGDDDEDGVENAEDDLEDDVFGTDIAINKPSCPIVVPLEYLLVHMIHAKGLDGATYSELSNGLSGMDVKNIEAVVQRAETCDLTPANLCHLSLKTTMETEGRERRIRVFTVPSYIEQLKARNLPPDTEFPATFLESAGAWITLTNDQLYSTQQQYRNHVCTFPTVPNTAAIKAWRKGPTKDQVRKRGRPKKVILTGTAKGKEARALDDTSVNSELGPKGRPRKYIRLLGPSGELVKRKRHLEVPVHPGLPTQMLYNERTGVFFEVPPSWSGKGPITLPADWETRTSPKKLIPPSTGKSASVENGGPKKRGRKRKNEEVVTNSEDAAAVVTNPTDAAGTAGHAQPLQEDGIGPSKKSRVSAAAASTSKTTTGILSLEHSTYNPSDAVGVGTISTPSQLTMPASSSLCPAIAACSETQAEEAAPIGLANTEGHAQQITTSKRHRVASLSPSLTELTSVEVGHKTKRVKLEAKHPKTRTIVTPTTRTDMSIVLKRREVLRCIQDLGGIVEGGHSLIKTHYEWALRQASSSNKDSSNLTTPGKIYSIDKRTMIRLVDALIAEKQIRQTMVGIDEATAGTKTVPVVFVVGMDQGRINTFVENLRNARLVKRLPALPREGATKMLHRPFPRAPAAESAEMTAALTTPLKDMEGLSDVEVRDLFLRDYRLIPQLYGYKVGKYRRAQTLHQDMFKYPWHPADAAEGRLVPMSFLFSDMTVRSFCECFMVTSYSSELDEFIHDPANLSTSLRASPLTVQQAIGLRLSSTKKKVWGLLEVLAQLGLLETRTYGADPAGQFRTMTPMHEATHLRLLGRAALYNFGAQGEDAPLAGVMDLGSEQQVIDWWYSLWQMSMSSGEANQAAFCATRNSCMSGDSSTLSAPEPMSALKTDLTRSTRWQTEYQLTKAQKRYLLAHVDSEQRESASLVEKSTEDIAFRIVVPVNVVERLTKKMAASVARRHGAEARQKGSRIKSSTKGPAPIEHVDSTAVQLSIQEKLNVRAKALDDEWEANLTAGLSEVGFTNSEELVQYLEPIRRDFRRDPSKFQIRILRCGLRAFAHRVVKSTPLKDTIPSAAGRLMAEARMMKKKVQSRKGERTRIKWTKDWDELALDAWVVVHSRLLAMGVPLSLSGAYGALDNVLPAVTSEKIRLRVKSLRAGTEAQSAYIDRLLVNWKEIAQELRGTEILPDPNPDDPVNFDLLHHVEVLRTKVRKGILSRMPVIKDQGEAVPLPMIIADLEGVYAVEVFGKPPKQLFWEPHASDDRREAALLSQSICMPTLQNTKDGSMQGPRKDEMMEAAIKMVVIHPESTFEEREARALLVEFDEKEIGNKVHHMVKRDKLVARNAADPGRVVGRSYTLAPSYLAALDQPYPSELFDEAVKIEMSSDIPEDAFVDWKLNCQDGEFAGALSLASNDMLNFEIDGMTCNRLLSKKHMYQTKLIDDSDIELSIGVKWRSEVAPQRIQLPETLVINEPHDIPVVDQTLRDRLMKTIHESGGDGLTPGEVFERCNVEPAIGMSVLEVIFVLQADAIQLVGYDGPRLVSSDTVKEWQVPCSSIKSEELSSKRVYPRQWVTIQGDRNQEVWERCVKKAFGVVMQKPGINERNLRDILSKTFDRQEINELLQHLLDEERILRVFPDKARAAEAGAWKIGLADERNEEHSYFYPSDSMW